MSKKSIFKIASALTAIALITGCAATGEQHKANVYRAGQLNQAAKSEIIQIKLIMPAQVEVDNTQGKKNAEMAGALLGALLGAQGSKNSKNSNTKANAVVGGAALGGAAGSMVSDKTLVEGVQITYESTGGKLTTSVQVGRVCEYKIGSSMLVSTSPTETRIQPNTECPKAK
jgi:outer membrane lipoprotein SlyB